MQHRGEIHGDGKNAKDWTIRIQAPKSVINKDMGKVQRLYGNGSEEFS